MNALSTPRWGSFRINTLKSSFADIAGELHDKGIHVEPYEWIENVYTFSRDDEYALKGTRVFYDGKIYLQSLASLLPVLVLAPKPGQSILDVCAAPGSKTTQLAAVTSNNASITALEQNQIRYDKLMYNARMQWATAIEGVKTDARKYLSITERVFDKILLDAPCSAEGRIFVPNEKTYGFWSLANIREKSELQYSLLSLAVKCLKKWATLVYSTCTLAPEENEGVVSRVLAENPHLSLESIDIWLGHKPWWREGLVSFENESYGENIKKAVRILPSDETEGFFLVKIVYQ
jgi:16S rRNA (cytosine1407-C5)-methyltransferase